MRSGYEFFITKDSHFSELAPRIQPLCFHTGQEVNTAEEECSKGWILQYSVGFFVEQSNRVSL